MNGWRIFSQKPGAAPGKSERECAFSSPTVTRFSDRNRRLAIGRKTSPCSRNDANGNRIEVIRPSFYRRTPIYCAAFAKNPAFSGLKGVYQPPGKIVPRSALLRSLAVSCWPGASEKAGEFMSTKLTILSAIARNACQGCRASARHRRLRQGL
jgi:hypothetical protein